MSAQAPTPSHPAPPPLPSASPAPRAHTVTYRARARILAPAARRVLMAQARAPPKPVSAPSAPRARTLRLWVPARLPRVLHVLRGVTLRVPARGHSRRVPVARWGHTFPRRGQPMRASVSVVHRAVMLTSRACPPARPVPRGIMAAAPARRLFLSAPSAKRGFSPPRWVPRAIVAPRAVTAVIVPRAAQLTHRVPWVPTAPAPASSPCVLRGRTVQAPG